MNSLYLRVHWVSPYCIVLDHVFLYITSFYNFCTFQCVYELWIMAWNVTLIVVTIPMGLISTKVPITSSYSLRSNTDWVVQWNLWYKAFLNLRFCIIFKSQNNSQHTETFTYKSQVLKFKVVYFINPWSCWVFKLTFNKSFKWLSDCTSQSPLKCSKHQENTFLWKIVFEKKKFVETKKNEYSDVLVDLKIVYSSGKLKKIFYSLLFKRKIS